MVRMVSLSDDAYYALAGLKHAGESFSQVVLKMYTHVQPRLKRKDIMEFAGMWADKPAYDRIFDNIVKGRDRRKRPWQDGS